VPGVVREQPRGRRYVRGGKDGGIDDGVPLAPAEELAQVPVAGAVTVQRLSSGERISAQPASKGRHIVAATNRLFDDGSSGKLGSAEYEKTHASILRAAGNARNALRQELTSLR
jgi:hypothetical protein